MQSECQAPICLDSIRHKLPANSSCHSILTLGIPDLMLIPEIHVPWAWLPLEYQCEVSGVTLLEKVGLYPRSSFSCGKCLTTRGMASGEQQGHDQEEEQQLTGREGREGDL